MKKKKKILLNSTARDSPMSRKRATRMIARLFRMQITAGAIIFVFRLRQQQQQK